ncbi:hypothetical protein IC757_11800 [Wenzhouxiangella sp. AB-CW3]|uniref:HdaA/DnaA family protein n=1 Tax=Wenzhouxiangella sp. AB-CW3 TaxID=2771012 RepID=UPI00168BF198|nr:hypothetical protein [Wenzhouxiangella sp. AB-CW3]QOC21720.1 hypothetical protein IC757_11800 [Wenzhouxiangella sp. AB-CW3]
MTHAQLSLSLKPPRRPSFDNFVTGDNGALIGTLKSGLEPGQWYFLAGPSGSGRSHLLWAVLDQCLRQGRQAQYIGLSQPGQLALLEQTSADWVLVDDADSVAGSEDGERALFNALNRWRQERAGVMLSGRGRDAVVLPDLKSRLGQATRLTISPLEERDLAELVTRLAREHEVPLGRGVTDYLLSRAPRNAGHLVCLVEALAARALSERRTLSIPMVRERLAAGRSPYQ